MNNHTANNNHTQAFTDKFQVGTVEPHSESVEQNVLGILLTPKSKKDSIFAAIQEKDFLRKDHQIIFRAMQRLYSDQLDIDIFSVDEFLTRKKMSDRIGGLAYLGGLAKNAGHHENIEVHIKNLRRYSLEREIFRLTNQTALDMLEVGDIAPAQRIAQLTEALNGLNAEIIKPISANDLMSKVIDHIDDTQNGSKAPFYKTGLESFDAVIGGGLKVPSVGYIGARPAMGKTSLSLQVAFNVSKNVLVTYLSNELTEIELGMRMFSMVGSIDINNVMTGEIDDAEYVRAAPGMSSTSQSKLSILDISGNTTAQIIAAIRTAHTAGSRVFFVDHIGNIEPNGKAESDSETVKGANYARAIWRLRNQLKDSVIVTLSPVNKDVAKRQDKRPLDVDLVGSGHIQSSADWIAVLYCDEKYNEDSADKGTTEVINRKQRHGKADHMRRLVNRLNYSRFEDFNTGNNSSIHIQDTEK